MSTAAEHSDTSQVESRLQAVLTTIRTRLPLPREMLQPADPEEKDRLAIILETTSLGRPVIDLAHQLSSKDLRCIFPLLAEPPQPGSRTDLEHDKLYLIIRERACQSLYRYGWAVFQHVYPSAAVARGLAIVCGILEIKQKSVLLQTAAQRPPQRRNNQPPLISHLTAPDSRHFIDNLLKSLARSHVPLERFMVQYDIDPDLPLGAALIGQCFIRGHTDLYTGSHQQFEHAVAHATPEMQLALVKRLFSVQDLDPETKTLCLQVVFRYFGDPESAHPLWSQIRKKDMQAYRYWITAATIGSHCRKNKVKARFYLRYVELVQQLERWDPQTLILYFTGFLIVDDRRHPLFSLYYEQDNPEILPSALQREDDGPDPGSTAMPHRRVEDAVSRASTQGPVGLLFDEKGIRFSASFIDFCLYQKRAASRNRLKNLPPI